MGNNHLREIEGKQAHDPLLLEKTNSDSNKLWSSPFEYRAEPVIIGAGPSGLAVAASLKKKGVPSVVLERSDCIASLWQRKTYDRLRVHLPKQFCELPFMGFPNDFPTYPTKEQFIEYLEDYANEFDIKPRFNEKVAQAEYDCTLGLWRVKSEGLNGEMTEIVCRWLVAATGENAEPVTPKIEGEDEFGGSIKHTSLYKCGGEFSSQKVLVVGCGNSGMEVCLDLCNHGAKPSIVVRDSVSILIS